MAVLFSAQTRDAYQGYDDAHYVNAWHGWCQELALANVPYDVLLDADLTASRLRRYRALLLPNAACLSERQMEAIERFVRDGGTLVATHETSRYDETGSPRRNLGLASVLGVRCRGILTPRPASIALREEAPVGGIGSGEVSTMEAVARVEAAPGARVLATTDTGSPTIVLNRVGRGRALYFAEKVGSGCYHGGVARGQAWKETRSATHRQLVRDTVAWAVRGELPLRVEAPPGVIVTLFRKRGRPQWILHLLNAQAAVPTAGRTIPEVYEVPYPALPPISVTLPGVRARRAALVSPDFASTRRVAARRSSKGTVVSVPAGTFTRYAILRVE
ncbi:MAG: hypothetical protein GX774_11735 [Armatimonadetes bacterium]|nr:hypothetical protein [Armatimonadota bacterium]